MGHAIHAIDQGDWIGKVDRLIIIDIGVITPTRVRGSSGGVSRLNRPRSGWIAVPS
jgi:hypothetical protein